MANKCLFPTCSSSGPLQTFRLQAIRKLLECATEKNDGETYSTIQGILDAQGEEASLELQKVAIVHLLLSTTSRNWQQRRENVILLAVWMNHLEVTGEQI